MCGSGDGKNVLFNHIQQAHPSVNPDLLILFLTTAAGRQYIMVTHTKGCSHLTFEEYKIVMMTQLTTFFAQNMLFGFDYNTVFAQLLHKPEIHPLSSIFSKVCRKYILYKIVSYKNIDCALFKNQQFLDFACLST